jgi:response regulator RpfG family c-di-GMP phosphodiesterase
MTDTLFSLYSTLQTVVLERQDDTRFILLTESTPWFCDLLPKACVAGETLVLQGISPFLDNFFFDANEVWSDQNAEPLCSGPWVEVNSEGLEIALQADAINHAGKCLLLIQKLGQSYEHQVNILQAARQNLLTREHLEAEIHKRTEQIRLREEEIAMRLLAASGVRDEETGAHVRRIGMYSAAIAESLGWGQLNIDEIRVAAPMHDIGKIGIPDNILLKPAKLTSEEYIIMQGHAEIGANMLDGSDIPLLIMAKDIAHCHHERWDGRGYPRGLEGADIPESARIVAIADVYDALVHQRIYKPAYPEAHAIELMTQQSGSYFDPDIFSVFIELLPEIRRIREEIRENAYSGMPDDHYPYVL